MALELQCCDIRLIGFDGTERDTSLQMFSSATQFFEHVIRHALSTVEPWWLLVPADTLNQWRKYVHEEYPRWRSSAEERTRAYECIAGILRDGLQDSAKTPRYVAYKEWLATDGPGRAEYGHFFLTWDGLFIVAKDGRVSSAYYLAHVARGEDISRSTAFWRNLQGLKDRCRRRETSYRGKNPDAREGQYRFIDSRTWDWSSQLSEVAEDDSDESIGNDVLKQLRRHFLRQSGEDHE